MSENSSFSYLVYTSTASTPFDDDQLVELLRKSRIETVKEMSPGRLSIRTVFLSRCWKAPRIPSKR
jgi:hypothetical protein